MLVRARGGLRVHLHAAHRVGRLRRSSAGAAAAGILLVTVMRVVVLCVAHLSLPSIENMVLPV
jgi:hypothetical protein